MSIISRAYFVFEDDDDNSGGWVTQHWNNLAFAVPESRPFINSVVPLPYICQLFSPKIFQINGLYVIL